MEEEERIQMHADKLYTRLVEQDRMIDEAKKAGREPPVFEGVLAPDVSVNTVEGGRAALATPPEIESLREEARAEVEKMLEGKTGRERHYEEQAIAAEIRAALETVSQWDERAKEVKQSKQERRDKGQASLGDRVSGSFGW